MKVQLDSGEEVFMVNYSHNLIAKVVTGPGPERKGESTIRLRRRSFCEYCSHNLIVEIVLGQAGTYFIASIVMRFSAAHGQVIPAYRLLMNEVINDGDRL